MSDTPVIGHGAFYPHSPAAPPGTLEGITPKHLREASNIPAALAQTEVIQRLRITELERENAKLREENDRLKKDSATLRATPTVNEATFNLPQNRMNHDNKSLRAGSDVSLAELESEHIRRVCAKARTLGQAALVLGIDPATLYRKRRKMGMPSGDSGRPRMPAMPPDKSE